MISTAEIASGIQPPMASNVRPITASGIPKVYPMMDIIQNVRNETRAMKMMHIMNVSGYHRRMDGNVGLGIVNVSTKRIGQL